MARRAHAGCAAAIIWLMAAAASFSQTPAHTASPESAGETGPARKPDLVLRGEITGKDHETYKLVPFDVPEGVRRITIHFDYTGRLERTTIDLGLLDPGGSSAGTPHGFRGWSGGNKRSLTVSATDATPSYLPGPLPAGRWHLLLGIPNIRAQSRSEFVATVHFDRQATFELDRPLRDEPGWYRGDFHAHTGHSDGSCNSRRGRRIPCPFYLTPLAAAERGLDFIAVTEHNTVSHLQQIRELQPYFDDVLLIPGIELTTFQGHANAIGITQSFDFRVGTDGVPDWNALLEDLSRDGALVSLNHPSAPHGEICMGCGWQPSGAVDLSRFGAVEVVNGLDVGTPISGIPFWERQLNAGLRLTGVGGSDNHDATLRSSQIGRSSIGAPTTVVYARNLSIASILEGLRTGNVFVDVEGSRNRLLEMSAEAGGREITMGGELTLSQDEQAQFTVRVCNVGVGRIEIVRDGKVLSDLEGSAISGSDHRMSWTEQGDGRRHWVRADVRDARGKLLLLGNPIYINRHLRRD